MLLWLTLVCEGTAGGVAFLLAARTKTHARSFLGKDLEVIRAGERQSKAEKGNPASVEADHDTSEAPKARKCCGPRHTTGAVGNLAGVQLFQRNHFALLFDKHWETTIDERIKAHRFSDRADHTSTSVLPMALEPPVIIATLPSRLVSERVEMDVVQ